MAASASDAHGPARGRGAARAPTRPAAGATVPARAETRRRPPGIDGIGWSGRRPAPGGEHGGGSRQPDPVVPVVVAPDGEGRGGHGEPADDQHVLGAHARSERARTGGEPAQVLRCHGSSRTEQGRCHGRGDGKAPPLAAGADASRVQAELVERVGVRIPAERGAVQRERRPAPRPPRQRARGELDRGLATGTPADRAGHHQPERQRDEHVVARLLHGDAAGGQHAGEHSHRLGRRPVMTSAPRANAGTVRPAARSSPLAA